MSITDEALSLTAAPDVETLTDDSFRTELIQLHNELTTGEPLSDFDANKNYMGSGFAGAMDGASIRYPRKSDKEELLKYALTKAKECEDPSNAAMMLAASVVAIHPLIDGNGRVSRALYSDLLGVDRPVEDNAQDVTTATNNVNRGTIDLGTAFTQDSLLPGLSDNYPYIAEGLDHVKSVRVSVYKKGADNDLESVTLSPESIAGLDFEERGDLVDAIGADEYGNTYRCDLKSLTFAVTLFTERYPDLKRLIYETPKDKSPIVNLHDMLPALSVEQRKEFVASLWDYRKLMAKAVIDFLSDDFGRNMVATSLGKTSIRNLVVERTNNLQSSKIRH